MRLANKVAVITGGGSGIGRSTVLRFLQEGSKVVFADYNAESGRQVLDEAVDLGFVDQVRFIKTDVAEESDIIAMFRRAEEDFGSLDIVFNNAGVGGAIGPVWELDIEDWDYTFDVLVKGVFLGIKHGSKVLRKQGRGGAIINTASIAGISGGCGPLSYSAAKAAVINLTRSASVQLAPDRIRVNAICPGFILSGLTASKNRPIEESAAKLDTKQPYPDHGTGDDIAGTALFLASEDSRFVNGEAIIVDGALTALGPDLWQRWEMPYEREMSRNIVNRGSTGEATLKRK
ncbi:MAG: SDR family oxidoreductase [Pseudomonadota bacterium]|nr:SDR family oxidoreductase [Pseudomonadota bacterium]